MFEPGWVAQIPMTEVGVPEYCHVVVTVVIPFDISVLVQPPTIPARGHATSRCAGGGR